MDDACDVLVLGAGAAGLMAAIRAAERGRSVILLEKNRKAGVKILISGGTRCNLTNARGLRNLHVVSGAINPFYDPQLGKGSRSIQQAFGPNGTFLGPALKALSVENTVTLFESEGLATKIEANGKVFPVSDKAIDVLDALLRRFRRSGAILRTECPVQSVEAAEGGFSVAIRSETFMSQRVIVAVGGQSYPGSGTTGDGYGIARHFGHSIVEPKPALVPLKVEPSWVRDLSGIALQDVSAAIVSENGQTLLERQEAILFAHFGLSGPAILDISRAVTRHEEADRLSLRLDFLPEERAEALDAALQSASRSGRGQVLGLIPSVIPRRLSEAILSAANIPLTRIGPELSRDERRRLVATIKGMMIALAGTLGFAKAEVTSGGVALDEVNPETLESRLQPGLHFAGEVLDLDGLIGGYNFQAAWSTGWLAGENV